MFTPEVIDAAKAKAGSAPVAAVGDLFIFKRPSRAAYDKWADKKVSGTDPTKNTRELAQECLVHPSWDAFIEQLDQRPSLLLNECLDCMLELAGVGGEAAKVEVKKL